MTLDQPPAPARSPSRRGRRARHRPSRPRPARPRLLAVRRPGRVGRRRGTAPRPRRAAAPAAAVGKLTPRAGLHRDPARRPTGDRLVRPLGHGRHDRSSARRSRSGASRRPATPARRPRPGPVLVVHQGDTVDAHAAQRPRRGDRRWRCPASPPSSFTERLAARRRRPASRPAARAPTRSRPAGPAPSSTRPATPPDGARQVAMGLAGALVVLPGGRHGLRHHPRPRTTTRRCSCSARSTRPSTPHPATFDMREFQPEVPADQRQAVPRRPTRSPPTRATRCCCATSTSGSRAARDEPARRRPGRRSRRTGTRLAYARAVGRRRRSTRASPSTRSSRCRPARRRRSRSSRRPATSTTPARRTADPLQVAFGGMMTFLDTERAAAERPTASGRSSTAHRGRRPTRPTAWSPSRSPPTSATPRPAGRPSTQAEFVVDDAVTVGAGLRHADDRHVRRADGPVRPAPSRPARRPTAPRRRRRSTCTASRRQAHHLRARPRRRRQLGRRRLGRPQPAEDGPADDRRHGHPDARPTARRNVTRHARPATTRAAGGTITAAEYFLDTAGADGTGHPDDAEPLGHEVALETATIPAADVQGARRGHDARLGPQPGLARASGARRSTSPLAGRPHRLRGSTQPRSGPTRPTGCSARKANPGYLVVSAEVKDRDAGGATQSNITEAEAFLDPGAAPAVGKGLSSSRSTAPSTHRRSRSTASSRSPRSSRSTRPAPTSSTSTPRTLPATGAASRPTTPRCA